jgi:hypothetical protein
VGRVLRDHSFAVQTTAALSATKLEIACIGDLLIAAVANASPLMILAFLAVVANDDKTSKSLAFQVFHSCSFLVGK